MHDAVDEGEPLFDLGLYVRRNKYGGERSACTSRKRKRCQQVYGIGICFFFYLASREALAQELEELFGDERCHGMQQANRGGEDNEEDLLFIFPVALGAGFPA